MSTKSGPINFKPAGDPGLPPTDCVDSGDSWNEPKRIVGGGELAMAVTGDEVPEASWDDT